MRQSGDSHETVYYSTPVEGFTDMSVPVCSHPTFQKLDVPLLTRRPHDHGFAFQAKGHGKKKKKKPCHRMRTLGGSDSTRVPHYLWTRVFWSVTDRHTSGYCNSMTESTQPVWPIQGKFHFSKEVAKVWNNPGWDELG